VSGRPALQGAHARLAGVERSRAAAPAPLGSGAGQRRKASTADQLERLSARLDQLIHDERLAPAASHRELERRIAEGEAIADDIRAVFRSTAPARAAPLFIETDGVRSRAGW
jgi:hypothetical protein